MTVMLKSIIFTLTAQAILAFFSSNLDRKVHLSKNGLEAISRRRFPLQLSERSSEQQQDRIVIVGVAGSIAEAVALKAMTNSKLSVNLILDRPPFSPLLNKESSIKTYLTTDDSFELLTSIKASKSSKSETTTTSQILSTTSQQKLIVVAVGDPGDESLLTSVEDEDDIEQGAIPVRVSKLFSKVSDILQKNANSKAGNSDISIICAASVDSETGVGLGKSSGGFGLGTLLRPASSLESSVSAMKSFFSSSSSGGVFGLFRYGKLSGGIPGAEPLPFLSMPLLEPELHPSYVLNTVLLNPISSSDDSSKVTASMKNAASEIVTRNSLAEAIVQLVSRTTSASRKGPPVVVDSFIQSIEGPVMGPAEWDKAFGRLVVAASKDANVELLAMDFGAVPKDRLPAFGAWLVDTWFPQALIEANAATILTGARPVRASKASSSQDGRVDINIAWEDLQPDLTVKAVGTVQISVSSEPPRITVRRLTAGGELPGEEQLLDRLEEGIYKSAFKKQFCFPLKSVASNA